MITGYGHFVQLADSLQWDEKTIDLTADIEAWGQLGDAEREQVFGLIAGFCIAEMAVAEHLGNFEAAASVDDSMAACFRSQARDEARHARFFDRVAAEIVGIPGSSLRERLETFRKSVSPDLVDLFEERLPTTAQRLADDHDSLTAAVGLYHMVLEGVVLLAGQNQMLDTLESLSVNMPGVRQDGARPPRRTLAHRVRIARRPECRHGRRAGPGHPDGGRRRPRRGEPHLVRGDREGRAAPPAPTAVRRHQVLVIMNRCRGNRSGRYVGMNRDTRRCQ